MIARTLGTTPFVLASAFTLAFALSAARGPADSFLYDAATYWEGSRAIVSGKEWIIAGNLELRGALTPVVFAVPAAVAILTNESYSFLLVLAWNSLLIAAIGAVLVPLLVARMGSAHRHTPIFTALSTAGLLGGFAPHPLMDIWATGLAVASVALLTQRQLSLTLLAGILFGVATNLRPATLPIFILVVGVWTFFHPKRSWVPILGAMVAHVPQALVSWLCFGKLTLTAPGTSELS